MRLPVKFQVKKRVGLPEITLYVGNDSFFTDIDFHNERFIQDYDLYLPEIMSMDSWVNDISHATIDCRIKSSNMEFENNNRKRMGKKIRLFGNLAFNKDRKLYYFYITRIENK
jgi:hypothetical protein